MNSESQSEQYEILKAEDKKGNVTNFWRPTSKHGSEKLATWQKRVYKKKEYLLNDQATLIEFNLLSKAIFRRDGNTCQSCFKTRRKLILEDKFLTAHHIIPRAEYDGNETNNLLTLCNECHDKIEEIGIKTKEEIYGYFTEDKKRWHRESSKGKKWQQWVYGGYQKP